MRIRILVANADPESGSRTVQKMGIYADPDPGQPKKCESMRIRIRIQSIALLYFLSAASIRFDRTAWILR